MGELMRRYWQPVAISAQVKEDPIKVKVLGEDLIVFRDKKDRPGLLHNRCCHRGTTLYYGRVEDEGIRCCYHGWMFDVEGRCVDMPCEADNGVGIREKVRQPWYEVQERYGLIFAYMGPPEKRPAFTRWSNLEDVQEGQKLLQVGPVFASGADRSVDYIDCNWLQHWENTLDPFHVQVLHATFSTVQFVEEFGIMPTVDWGSDELGAHYVAYRDLEDGRKVDRVTCVWWPNTRSVPSVELKPGPGHNLSWVVPQDDETCRSFAVFKVPEDFEMEGAEAIPGKKWSEMTEEEHRRYPGDWEAQSGQGPISLHSEEHLAGSDGAIRLIRAGLRDQLKTLENGGDPAGVFFDDKDAYMEVTSGNFFHD
ncbi:MAG: Rieske 2Fe-2S domain-containing protein [Proteobacteria bacterium]|nr:Rieske 2Fe-2S domain-containing protein [Pseudomonadota bacterium]